MCAVGRVWLGAVLGVGVAVSTVAAKSLPVPFESEYLAENWGLEEGFPENSCSGIVQAPDGYLWMGTFRGLVRFNGQQFKAWAPAAMPNLKATGIINLYRDRRQRVWLSTMAGLVMNDGATWTRWQENDGWGDRTDYVRSYAEDAMGGIVLTRFSGRIMKLEGGGFRELPALAGTGGAWAAFDGERTLYAARAGTPWRWEDGDWRAVVAAPALRGAVLGLGQARNGDVLVVGADELVRLRRGTVVARVRLSQPVRPFWQLTEDASGAVWLPAIDAGVFRIKPDGQVKHFLKPDGLPHSGGTRAVYAGDDGSIWIGSGVGGVARFRAPRFRQLGEAEGLGERVILTLAPLRDGRVLLSTYGAGLTYFDGVKAVLPVPLGLGGNVSVRAVLRRADDSIWVGTFGHAPAIPAPATSSALPTALPSAPRSSSPSARPTPATTSPAAPTASRGRA